MNYSYIYITYRITRSHISFVVLSLKPDFNRLKRAAIGNKIISRENNVQKSSPISGKSSSIFILFEFYKIKSTRWRLAAVLEFLMSSPATEAK